MAYILIELLKQAVNEGRERNNFRCLWCGNIKNVVFTRSNPQHWSWSHIIGREINGFYGDHSYRKKSGDISIYRIIKMHDKYEQRKAL